MASAVSIYLRDDTLRKLDAAVEKRAASDRALGRTGRQVASRSSVIEQILNDHLDGQPGLSVEDIRYYVVPLAKEYGAERVSLFGSYARGEATEESDVDILLEKGSIRGLRVLDFKDELERRLRKSVDVVTTAGASERFLRKIANDEVLLYAAS